MDIENHTGTGFVPAVETYLAEQAALLERAHERLAGRTHLWWGASGAPLTGEQIAVHAEAADRYLASPNAWLPHATTDERTILYMAEHGCDELAVPLLLDQRNLRTALINTSGEDTRFRLQMILDDLIAASTGAPYAMHDVWDGVPGRTLGEVRGLLCAAAAYARRYGPIAAAARG